MFHFILLGNMMKHLIFFKIRRVTNEKVEIIQMRLQCVGCSCAYNLNAVQF